MAHIIHSVGSTATAAISISIIIIIIGCGARKRIRFRRYREPRVIPFRALLPLLLVLLLQCQT